MKYYPLGVAHSLSRRRAEKEKRSQLGERSSHAHFLWARFSAHTARAKSARSRFTLSFACRSIHLAKKRTECHSPFEKHFQITHWHESGSGKESFVGTSSAEDDIMLFCVKNKQISLWKRFGNWKLQARAKSIRLLLNRKEKITFVRQRGYYAQSRCINLDQSVVSVRIMKY